MYYTKGTTALCGGALSHVCDLVTEICAWQHIYYHLSLSDSDRLMLLVKMLPKLILFFCGSWWPQTCIPDLQKPSAYHPLEEMRRRA